MKAISIYLKTSKCVERAKEIFNKRNIDILSEERTRFFDRPCTLIMIEDTDKAKSTLTYWQVPGQHVWGSEL
jgi:hypothetical protein